MQRIKNLTNSPYEIINAKGEKVHLPARGEIEVDVHPLHLPRYRSLGYFRIEQGGTPDPLDHDGDGKKGGSVSAEGDKDELARLRDEYTELTGKKPHHMWKQERLQAEIDKALAD